MFKGSDMSKRKKVESLIIETMNELDPSGKNASIYKNAFKGMSNSEFDIMMEMIRDKKYGTTIFAPNNDKDVKISLERNRAILKKRNIKLFKKLDIYKDGSSYSPNIEFLVMPMMIRRMAQRLEKNFSTHEDLKSRNAITGQVTGKSKSARITTPELQILNKLKMKAVLSELFGARAGDITASYALRSKLFRDGKVTQKEIEPFVTATGSTKAVKAFFKAMHIDIAL